MNTGHGDAIDNDNDNDCDNDNDNTNCFTDIEFYKLFC